MNNYCKRAELTHSEKVKMFMKLPKKELVEMLINCNEIIDKIPVKYE
jgi:SAM-dependent MidA family methyltransferase